jgi:hypothetical protein
MRENERPFCPECDDFREPAVPHRREFLRVAGLGTASLLGLGGARVLGADDKKVKPAERPGKAAEELVRELHAGLSADQKKDLMFPFDHGADNGKRTPSRLRMYNAPFAGKSIGRAYTKPQQELVERILKAMCSDDEGYRRISRGGRFDTGGGLLGCGAHLFGDPTSKEPYAWMFSGHHLTIRCDGNFEDGVAWAGPLYYGHSVQGYSRGNVFNYQTRSVLKLFDALSDKQHKQAIMRGNPGEGEAGFRPRAKGAPTPGVTFEDLTADQRKLVEKVMADLLSPFRKEDGGEVLAILKANGGLDRLHMAYYEDARMRDGERWHFWRLEGPGFIWNYRVLPHVHCYVRINKTV